MTLKIEKIFSEGKTRICLSGQLRFDDLEQLRAEIRSCESEITLDLEEVELVDLAGVHFLNECESLGISILLCSPYILEWMSQEKSRLKK